MVFDFNFYSSFLLIFFVHALVYSILCWRKAKNEESKSMFWLGWLLFLGAFYILAWMLGFAGWYDNQPYKKILLYAPTNTSWLLGPVMYVYIQSFLNPAYKFGGKQWFHFLPFGIYLLGHLIIFVLDNVVKISPLILHEEIDPDYTDYVQIPGLAINMVYTVLAIRFYMLYRRLMLQLVSFADWVRFRWIRNFLLAFLLFIIITLIFDVIGFFREVHYTGSWWYYLSFALIFYSIAIAGYSNRITPAIGFMANTPQHRPAIYWSSFPNPETGTQQLEFIDIQDDATLSPESALSNDEEALKQLLLRAMEEQKLYEDQELSLLVLARYLGTNPSVLSRVINKGCGMNFNDFVNNYRVKALQQLLLENRHKNETLLSLAFEVGFNSKATFNRAFQKFAGCSPVDWIAKNIST